MGTNTLDNTEAKQVLDAVLLKETDGKDISSIDCNHSKCEGAKYLVLEALDDEFRSCGVQIMAEELAQSCPPSSCSGVNVLDLPPG